MKKVFFYAVLFAAASMTFVGCKKKAAAENAEEAPATEQVAAEEGEKAPCCKDAAEKKECCKDAAEKKECCKDAAKVEEEAEPVFEEAPEFDFEAAAAAAGIDLDAFAE